MSKLSFLGVWIYVAMAAMSWHSLSAQESLDIDRLQRATVFVMQAQNIGNNLNVTCISSGTIVSRDGLILTNAHNTVPSSTCPGNTILIGLSIHLNEPPITQYRAEIAQADSGLDLALLRITRELDGRLVDRNALSLPFVEIADSGSIALDDTIVVIGFPGIGDDPVRVVRGTVNGFVLEPRSRSGTAWIKTSAEIPGTMSGGGAYDRAGRLVGIPTTAPLSNVSGALGTCIPIQDTNLDSLVNTSDRCIAVGGFINVLRPSNFAKPLLRAASLQLSLEIAAQSVQSSLSRQGIPRFTRLFFSPSVNDAGMPTTVIRSLPAGSTSLFLFFDYENMTPETVYELRVTLNGIPNPVFSLSPVRWSGGERGMWYVGSSGQAWPNGVYEFTLFADGVAAPSTRLVVGEAPANVPAFSDIVFGILDPRGNPLGNGFILPTGATASARFVFRNMQDGVTWSAIWYLNGAEVNRTTNTWNAGASGTNITNIESPQGVPPGLYRIELYIETRLSATSDFIIAGAQQGALPQVVTNLHFTTAANDQEALTAAPISNFSDRISALYALFDWQQIAAGTPWTLTWYVDREVFFEQTLLWTGAANGQNYLLRLSAPEGIPDATYVVEIRLNNILLGRAEAQVGIGQLSIDQFAQASGVLLRGRILDADTGQGIPGVSFILISADFSVAEFIWSQSQVYAIATTDQNGVFEIARPLQYSTENNTVAYSVIIAAKGYVPISADGIEVTLETPNPLELTIYLYRD